MTSPARAGSTLLAAKPTAVARKAFANVAFPSGGSRYCQRNARMARLASIVASDRASHIGRARPMSPATRQRSTLWRNNANRPAVRASTTIVRKCDRIGPLEAPSTITALRPLFRRDAICCCCQHGGRPCKMRFFPPRTVLPLAAPILETTLAARRPDRQGKVRDIYDFGDRLLIVATDRISAFDYVLGSGIPGKGKILTQISTFWFDRLAPIVTNHVISTDPAAFPLETRPATDVLRGR